jgi:hypothetical protein
MLINWLKGSYLESFPGRHVTFDALVSLRELEGKISNLLVEIVNLRIGPSSGGGCRSVQSWRHGRAPKRSGGPPWIRAQRRHSSLP